MQENQPLCELKNTKGMVVSHDRIEGFQAAFRGEVIKPGDSGYEAARKIWNASIDNEIDGEAAIKLYNELVKSPEDRLALEKEIPAPNRGARQSRNSRKTETTAGRNGPNP